MNRITTTTLCIALLTLAFSCQDAMASHDCANLTTLRLTATENHISLNDNMPVCVSVPGSFRIKIKDTVHAGDATVEQKATSTITIEGDNSADAEYIDVTTSGTAMEGQEFKFWIKVKDVGMLDPRIKVKDNDVMLMIRYHQLEEAVELIGLTWEEVIRYEAIRKEE